jgi:hypothetical protein
MQTMQVIIAVLVLCMCNPTTAFSQPETLSKFLRSEFKTGVLLILEGDRYVDKERKELRVIADSNKSIKDKITAIAEKCDYEVTESNGAYLLHKRYSAPQELPCVTEKEILRFNEDASRVVGSFFKSDAPTGTSLPHIRNLLLSLSEAEWELVQRDVIPVKTLSPQSQQIFADLLVETCWGGLSNLCNVVRKWGGNIDNSELDTGKYESGDRYLISRVSIPGMPSETWAFAPQPRAGIANTGAAEAKKLIYQNASFYSSDIGDILQEANANPNSAVFFTAEDALLAKPVSVVGLESASPIRVVEGIAKLYNLRLAVASKVVKLAQRRIQIKQGADAGECMALAVPYPLQKMMGKRNEELSIPPVPRTVRRRNHDRSTLEVLYSLYFRSGEGTPSPVPLRTADKMYRVAYVLNLFDNVLREIRDNDMARIAKRLSPMEMLYLQYRRTPGSPVPLSFKILTDKNGKLSSGMSYESTLDVPRN